MFKPHVQDQAELFPPRVGDLIPEDDPCRVVSEIVDSLDLSNVAAGYSTLGQHAFSPHTMLKLLFFGYAQGVRSSRAIAEKVRFDVRYTWLAGKDRPGKTAIADFRKRNLAVMEELFVQVILLCARLGMVKVGHWAIDGTKLKASAGNKSHRKRELIEREQARLREEIREALAEAQQADDEDPDEPTLHPAIRHKQERARRLKRALESFEQYPERKYANTTDPDAPKMKRKGGGFEPSYNPQLTVDADSQVVLAADVCTDQNDVAQLQGQLDQAQANTNRQPKEVSADAGYASGPNFAALQERGVTAYIPPIKDPNKRQKGFGREDFRFEPQHDRFICPAGEALTFVQTKKKQTRSGTYRARVYKFKGCCGCELASQCLKKGAATRSIEVSEHDGLIAAMRERCSNERGRSAYAKRKQSVEPVFGVVKWVMGFRSFLLRGMSKVRGEWRLAMTAFNLRKIWTSGRWKASGRMKVMAG